MFPSDLPALPDAAQNILRYLNRSEDAVPTADLMASLSLSERGFGKAIRRLITLKLVHMPEPGVYALTERGRVAVPSLPEGSGSPPGGEILSEPEAPLAATGGDERRFSVLVAEELVAGTGALLLAGFDASPAGAPVRDAQPIVLSVAAPGCTVEPSEQSLDLLPDEPAGPVRFKLTPEQPGQTRVSIAVRQLSGGALHVVGGIYFDLRIQPFPTPRSAEFQTLGAAIVLKP